MVFELPELQGEIGAVYASLNGYDKTICLGIKEHYMPNQNSLLGAIISIADKLDNIVCLFAIGKIPTGSTDPFALRRQAQGIIDTTINHSLRLDIIDTIRFCINNLKDEVKSKITEKIINEIQLFIRERLITRINSDFRTEHDITESVCSVGAPLKDIISTIEKFKTVNESFYTNQQQLKSFLIAAKRLVRIVDLNTNGGLDIKHFTTESEKQLFNSLNEIEQKEYNSYSALLKDLTTLTEPINLFFDKVLVNDPDPKTKQARQALLKKGKDLFERICDFNKIKDRS